MRALIPSASDPAQELAHQIGQTHTQLKALVAAAAAVSPSLISTSRARLFVDDVRVLADDLDELTDSLAAAGWTKGTTK